MFGDWMGEDAMKIWEGGQAMTKEQEAIKNLTGLLRQRNEKQVQITTYDLFENIETVLNMLKEKDELYHKALEDLVKADRENIKKDKIIDLMAEWIEKHTKYYDEDGCYCEVEKEICEKDIECKNCIKQYFERKSKEC